MIQNTTPHIYSIVPFSSAIGPGGRSSIVASDTGRTVYCSVKPATAWPYSFSGIVKLRYHSGLGSTVSGAVSMNKNNGGVAYLTGTAYALNNTYYKVLPGVSS